MAEIFQQAFVAYLRCGATARIPDFFCCECFLPSVVGGILWLVLEIFLFLITTVKLSVEDYRNNGGGQYIYMVLIRKIFRRTSRVYYFKGIFEENEEDGN